MLQKFHGHAIYEWESERVRSEKDVRGGKDYGQFHTEKQ